MKLPKYIQVEGNPSLVRDTESQAILNTNKDAYEAYKKRREDERRIRNGINEIENIKNEISEIKEMLKLILNKN